MSRRKRSKKVNRNGEAKGEPGVASPAPNKEHLAGMLDWLLPEEQYFLQNAVAWQYQMVAQVLGVLGAVLGVVGSEAPDRRLCRSRSLLHVACSVA